MDALARSQSLSRSSCSRVLVDATWDNPNFWLRYSLLRAALGLTKVTEAGLLGPFSRDTQARTLNTLGVGRHFDLMDTRAFKDNAPLAKDLAASLTGPGDIMELSLPENIPGFLLYDYILKRQRLASVQVDAPDIIEHIRFFLNCLSASSHVLSTYEPDLVVASHNVGYQSTLVWAALRRGIRVIVPYGDNGVLLFSSLDTPTKITDLANRPKPHDLARLTPNQAQQLRHVGRTQLERRLTGQDFSLAAVYAYIRRKQSVDRESMRRHFNWPDDRPIVAVYASNWFDFPHTFGMKNFHDFYDWINFTLAAANKRSDVSWLFKAHPCDDWYGGIRLEKLLSEHLQEHIQLADRRWNGNDMLHCIDAFVTFHGTVGLEATALGKPVLVADTGWYGDWGFVRTPRNREDYGHLLGQDWWTEIDTGKNAMLAQLFAGWYWGRPAWQRQFLLEDDSHQGEIYARLPELLTLEEEISREIATIRTWFDASEPYYHTFKMVQAQEYVA